MPILPRRLGEADLFLAQAAFVKVTEAASTANLPELKRLCTPQYYSVRCTAGPGGGCQALTIVGCVLKAVRRGLEATAASRSCVDGVHVKAFIGEPKVLQARLVYLTPQAMRTWTTPPEFAQITVRIETRQAPVTTTDSQALKRVRRKGGKGGKGGTGSAHADVGDQVWEQAFSDDGHPYYFTPDGFATWERPTQFGVVGIAPVHLRDTGAVREVMNAEDSADASDGDQAGSSGEPSSRGRKGNRRRQSSVAAEERVVNYAVFERALVPGGDQEWKLTHL